MFSKSFLDFLNNNYLVDFCWRPELRSIVKLDGTKDLNNVIITVDSLELNVLRIQPQRPVHRLQSSIICCSKEQLEDMIIPKSFRLLALPITYKFGLT